MYDRADPLQVAKAVTQPQWIDSAGAVAMVTTGRNHVVSVFSRADIIGSGRAGAPSVKWAAHAASSLPVGTVVLHDFGDGGLYCVFNGEPHRFARLQPNLWILSFNPCVDEHGRLGLREIAVPPFDAAYPVAPDPGLPPVLERNRAVRWRGVTTGDASNFKGQQRYSTVAQLQTLRANLPKDEQSIVDVGFSGNVQGQNVSPLLGGLSREDMGNAQVQLDLDGNANAWAGGRWKLDGGSAVVKVRSKWVLWYYKHLKNGTHLLAYDSASDAARGALSLVRSPQSNETKELLASLGRNARAFALKHFTTDAMRASVFDAVRCSIAKHDPDADSRVQV